MYFIVVLLSSLIVFVVTRLFLIFVGKISSMLLKLSDNNLRKKDMILSVSFLVIYIQGFTGAVQGVINRGELSNLEWYMTYTCIGIACIIWCYFKWELAFKALPQFEYDKKAMAIKKILVFSLVMIISFYYGFAQTEKVINGKEVDTLLIIANATIIPGIIALDRIFNQFAMLRKSR